MRNAVVVLLSVVAVLVTGCSTKWVPDAESSLNPPVAYQQQFIAESLDDVFTSMDFSRLRGEVVEIEIMGIYADGDLADYLRAKLQLELAKAGAISETGLVDKVPTYKANIMLRVGGVNDLVKSAFLYEWRQKQYIYEVEVAIFNILGKDYFVQSGKGESAITVSRTIYLIFFPVPLPSEWSTTKGDSFFPQVRETYDATKKAVRNPQRMFDPASIKSVKEYPDKAGDVLQPAAYFPEAPLALRTRLRNSRR